MSLLVMGLSHHSAPLDLLERVVVAPETVPHMLHEIVASEHVAQAVAVSTCNRLEVYAHVSAFHGALQDIAAVVASRADMDVAELAPHCYAHYSDDALAHVLRVAAGLDSMVVGEPQIMGQLRAAYAQAKTAGTVDTALHEVMQHALRAGKRVRATTAIDGAGQSVVTAALDNVRPILGSLTTRRAVVVGAGAMATLAATTLRREGIGALTIVNRTPAKAARLAAKVDGLAGDMGELAALLARADLVITATGALGTVLDSATVSQAFAIRRETTGLMENGPAPLVICDLAMPRDVDTSVAQLPDVHMISIATLAGEMSTPHGPKAELIREVEEILEAELAHLVAVRQANEVAPAVTALRRHADAVVAAELAALRQRAPHLSEQERSEVERTVRRVVATLLHEPTVRIKQLAAGQATSYADALTQLFSLDVAKSAVSAALAVATPSRTTVVDGSVAVTDPGTHMSLPRIPAQSSPIGETVAPPEGDSL